MTDELKKLLLLTTESGMGYHYFEYTDPDLSHTPIAQKEYAVVSNSNAIFLSERGFPISVFWNKDLMSFSNIKNDDILEIKKSMQGISEELKLHQKYEDEIPSHKDIKSADLTPPFTYITRQGDEFRRLSAFRDDNRILKDGSLKRGSYGTTILDLNIANSGVAAVGRYALPNRLAACYVYQIIPPPGTKVLFGTVTPNFGLCGGGVEVYFPLGCAEGSVRLMGAIPEF